MCDPVSSLCFVIRYRQLQVIESPDTTHSTNKECVMSPHKKPGGKVVLDWFTQQVSTGQPGSSHLSVLLAQGAAQLPSRLWEDCRPRSLRSSLLNMQRQVIRTSVMGQK